MIAITDTNGEFNFKYHDGKIQIKFTLIEYEHFTKKMEISKDLIPQRIIVYMKESATELDAVVVTGSKYGKKITEEIVSLEILKSQLINNSNPYKVSDVFLKIPGLYMLDG